ncbi:hypothetical protein SAMN05892883_4310 [Jatrophihabitans sp. GAS493]|uniref:DUF5709 domain-containing protein n=1 Tax=Jatrophihabitans sp. GAS493 TaxID=1907575 RepID=UPI000BB8CF00|nr:DUF5709 domain-containing protein [Jatrophihabitans sp. GAS493]SOD75105.1 hypothetical protein SAMN05892883_4310 [Jatrophihabitans sp. GAS493]
MTGKESDDLYAGGYGGAEQFDPSDTLTGDNTEDPLDAGYTVPDTQPLGTRFGTTAREQEAGETLDQRLSEEEPDIDADDVAFTDVEGRTGRLVAPDEGSGFDDESDAIAYDVGRAGSASSAEEAAIHIINE